jgi:hypothetical protein
MSKRSDPPSAWFLGDGITRLIDAIGGINFTFTVNGYGYSVSVIEAILLSSRILPELENDCTRARFEINDSRIDHQYFNDLLQFVRCETVSITASSRRSLLLLSRYLGNASFEQVFFGLQFESALHSIELNFCSPFSSLLADTKDLSSMSIEDFSLLDIETIQTILSSEDLRLESEDWLLKAIISLGSNYSSLLDFVRIEFLTEHGIREFFDHFGYCEISEGVWDGFVRRLRKVEDTELITRRFVRRISNATKEIQSVIISSIPVIFADFVAKEFRLLYRGTRDGFHSQNFHAKVDGHSHTITLIETTKGFVFGAYVACLWDSSGEWKADKSRESFLFTVTNPHNLPARKFPLKPGMDAYTLFCYSHTNLVWIGAGGAIGIPQDCTSENTSQTRGFGAQNSSFSNDTGINGGTLFTGEDCFTVKELEIFHLLK